MTSGSNRRKRNRAITTRFDDDEFAKVDGDADRAGLTPPSYIRDIALRQPSPRRVRRPVVERRELARLLGAVGHVGGNLNQIAHHLNAGMPAERRALWDALESLAEVREAILKALGRDPGGAAP